MLEISRGNVPGQYPVDKFGRAPEGVQTTPTDIWDRADASATQQIWTAPTTARIHAIVSTSGNDTSAGTGAKTLKVYGLTSWSTTEVSETIIMNGTTPVNTVNSYVIIYRMKVVTKGSAGPNVGTITATAATDGTVTAQINIGSGQTQMAIFGIPSTQKAYMTRYFASVHESASPVQATFVDIDILFNPEPDVELTGFLTKHTSGVNSFGTSASPVPFEPYKIFEGPGILKIQATATSSDIDFSASFDLILVDN
jgi:hypothetical protein